MVYIKEAHAIDSSSPSSFKGIEDAVTSEERTEVCVRCIDDLNIPIPAIIDDLDDSVNLAYGAHPDRLYLVGRDGRVAYAGGQGPRGFKPDELEQAIKQELSGAKRAPKDRLLAALDKDGDGKLSAREIAGAAEALKQLDLDGDGELSAEELGPAAKPAEEPAPNSPSPQAQAAQGMIDRLDKDGDGKLSKDEAPGRMAERFKMMDTNDDGFVDLEEMQAVMDRGGRGGRDRRRPGDR